MAQDDRGRGYAERTPCRCGCGAVRLTAEMTSSDCDVVRQTHDTAMASGACASSAWRAAVGAYLERHPGASVFTAERVVSALIRLTDGGSGIVAETIDSGTNIVPIGEA